MRSLSCDRIPALGVALVLTVGAFYAALAALAGPPPATRFPGDDFLWFGGALRVAQGQVPHADFYTPLGALYFQVPAWIMAVTGRSVAAFSGAVAVFGATLASLTWAACRKRMAAPFALALTALTLVFLLSIRAYGYEFHALGFAAYYNKLGSALLIAAMVLAFTPRANRTSDRADGHGLDLAPDLGGTVLLAVALALAFYLKVTFFALIAGLVVAGAAVRHHRAPLRAGLAIAAVAAGASMLIGAHAVLTDVPLLAYLADIRLAADAKASVWTAFPWILYILWPPEFLLYLLVPIAVAALTVPAGDAAARLRHGAMLATGVAVAAVLPLVNSQGPDAFFPCALAFALAGTAWRRRGPETRFGNALRALFLALGAGAIVLPNLGGEIYGRIVPLPTFQGSDTVIEVPVSGARPWRFYPHRSQLDEAAYARALAAGVAALRPLAGGTTTIATLGFANPFPFLLGTPAPPGGAAWWHVGINLDAKVAKMLGVPIAGACLVMEPKRPYMRETQAFLRAWADATLARDYTPVHDGVDWRIWRARTGCKASPS